MSGKKYGCCNECGCSIAMKHYPHCSLYERPETIIIGGAKAELGAAKRVINEREQTITQQAKEIDELKAHVERLRAAIAKEELYQVEHYGESYSPWLTDAVNEAPEQSLAAHDLIKRNEVIAEQNTISSAEQAVIEAAKRWERLPLDEQTSGLLEALNDLKTTQD